MNQNAPCKLCSKAAKLHKKSHIIPDFMYQGLFDEKHRMIQTSNSEFTKKTIQQSGVHEKYILCSECEIRFSKLEKYVSMLMYAENVKFKNPPEFKRKQSLDGINSMLLSNFDYSIFKLFVLSILWRSHISSHIFFKNVDIGECESEVRKMLLVNDSKSDDEYKISMVGILDRNNITIKLVTQPFVSTLNGGKFTVFFFNGFFYFIDLKPNSGFTPFKEYYLKGNGEIEIPLLKGEFAHALLEAIGLKSEFATYITYK